MISKPISRSSGQPANKKTSREIDQLDALTEVDNHLQFAAQVIERPEFSDAVRKELRTHIARIQQRRSDPNLYLAVIGEFSSGKSTFINALLRDEMLKTSALVTTSTATKLRHGKKIGVEAHFKSPYPRSVKVNGKTGRVTITNLPGVDDLDLRQFVHAVTSDTKIAAKVTDVMINHPAQFLADGIVIIDTPGANALNPEHGAITRHVVQNEADAAIVIIPATVPLSNTLLEFLKGTLRPYLHRCIFIVSRMDQIPLREQRVLLKNVQTRLEKELKIDPSVVHSCSAQMVINSLDKMPENGLDTWCEQFADLEKFLMSRLRRERTLSIAENLVRLLSQLFEQLDGQLRKQWEQYEKHQEDIKRNTICDLTSFTAEQHSIGRKKIEERAAAIKREIDNALAKYRKKTTEVIYEEIFDSSDLTELDGAVRDVGSTLKDKHEKIESKLREVNAELATATTEVGKIFDERFASEYKRLEVLGGKIRLDNSPVWKGGTLLNVDQVLQSSRQIQNDFTRKDQKIENASAVGGAVLGTILLPGIGTIAGLILGGFASKWFGPSLQERKQQIWSKLSSSLDAYFNSLESEAKKALGSCAKQAQKAIEGRIDTYISTYKAVVDSIVAEQKSALNRLTALQQATQSDLSEIQRRRSALAKKQQRLLSL